LIGICLFKDFYRGVSPAGIEGVQKGARSKPALISETHFNFNHARDAERQNRLACGPQPRKA